jgi:hypothetical protein
LTSWWPGDGVVTDIVGTNNAILQGGATSGAAGLVGSGFGFDGTNNYVQIPDAPDLRPTNFTIEAWVRFTGLDSQASGNSPAGDQYIVFKQNSRVNDFEGFDLSKTRVGTQDVFRLVVTSSTGQVAQINSVSLLSTGVWYHVAGVRGSNFLQIYVNGQLERQTNVNFAQDYGPYPLYFGSTGQPFWDHKFRGVLDEVSLYNRALSSNEIAAVYAAGASGKCKAISITAQPQSQTVVGGSSAVFGVGATGLTPINYQWRFNGANIGGATGSILTRNNVQPTDAGNYTVVLTNKISSATSAVATLTVLVTPIITTQPQSQTNVVGASASFNATASGTAPLFYQWRFSGADIPGATDTALNLSNIQTSDAGNYTLAVTNSAGAVTSTVASLTVIVPPTMAVQPQSRTNVTGTVATFSGSAAGSAPLSYQWQFNGANVTGATASTLVLGNVQAGDAGNYTLVAGNWGGAVTSAVAVLTVWVPPAITSQPQSRTNVIGTTAAFGASASGTAPLSYQWQFNGVSLGGVTDSSLVLANVQPVDAGNYAVRVSNSAGAITSAIATLTVLVPPAISAQPQSRTNIAGTTASFNGAASGSAPFSYQWQFNGANIAGATSATLNLPNVQVTDAGEYSFVVTNAAGGATSAVAVLTVLVPPNITNQPNSRTNVVGTAAAFSASATGTAPLGYQWQFNGLNIVDATDATLTLVNLQAVQAGNYTVTITNVAGAATSAVAVLTVWVPPSFAASPIGRTNAMNTVATFSATAVGTAPISYQWLFNGANLANGGPFSGVTSPNLTITNVQLNMSGDYSVLASNAAGTLISFPGTLLVVPPDCDQVAPGLVSWWPGEGNASDLFATNNGSLLGGATATAAGMVGTGISFDGTNSYVQIPDSPQLHPTNLTIEAWVRFSGLDSQASGGSPPGNQYIVFKPNTRTSGFEGFDLSKTRDGAVDVFRFMVTSAAGQETELHSVSTISTGVWYHVAGVRGANFLQLYVNGQLERQTNVTAAQDYGAFPLFFGSSGQSYWDHKFKGTLDEVSLYNRALTATEIAAVYAAGISGKCKAVGVKNSPQSQTVVAGNSAVFSVTASGLPPLSYQWSFSGGIIAGATSSVFTRSSVQANDAGSYSVMVSNRLGSVNSAMATLNVLLPPTMVVQPQSRTNISGTSGTLSALATGTPPLGYQWQCNGTNLMSATGPTLFFSDIIDEDEGAYWVVVTNIAGVVTSAVATLTVLVPPEMITQPQSRTNIAGSTATFSVAVNGTAPLSYQWQFNGASLGGATSANLVLNNVQPANTGNYSVVVSNAAGSTVSGTATLTVLVPPFVTIQPRSTTNIVGTTATISAAADGTAPLGYQWRFKGANVAGGTGSSLILNNVQLDDAGDYLLVVTNVAGSTISSAATLTVWVPPAMAGQPQSRTNVAGTTATFSASASGTAPLSYQWQFNGNNITGATGTTLILNGVQPQAVGNYVVTVTNSAGAITSAPAVLTVLVPPTITAQPQSRTNVIGTTATFTAAAAGTAPFSYQWQFNGANIAGATQSVLNLINVSTNDAGNYTVTVTNSGGVITSDTAILTVWVPPVITTTPQSRTNILGTSADFNAAASGTAPIAYQWQFNGVSVNGATGTTLSLGNVQSSDGGNYSVLASNAAGTATSASALLTVLVPPSIVTPPQSATNILGLTAEFTSTATGTAPLNYQWQFNGTPLDGATGSKLTLSNLQASNAGNYVVSVTNVAGAITSAPAVLTVLLSPTIYSHPVSQTVPAGTNVGFSVAAAGAQPMSYQWQFNGSNLSDSGPFNGTTNSTFSINYALTNHAGNYSVVISNVAGLATSSMAGLIVTLPDCRPSPPGLVSWWAGEGNAKDLAGTNHGTLQGTARANAAGFVGSAFGFDGTNGSLLIPDSTSLRPASFALDTWVRFESLDSFRSGSSPPGQQYLVFKQNSRTNNFEGYALAKARVSQGDVITFVVSSAAGQSAIVQSSTLVNTGMWYHVTAMRGPDFLSLYVNGQMEGQTNVSFAQDYGNYPLYFGTSGQSYNDGRFAGVLDEVTLYNRVLSPGEITAIYRAANAGLCKAPVLVDQPLGGTAYRGGNFTFTASAAGASPLGYQWQKDGVPLANATRTSLTVSNAQYGSGGNYSTVVTNAFGVASSAPASLTVKIADVSLALSSGGIGNTQRASGLSIQGVAGQLYGIQYSDKVGPLAVWIGLTNVVLPGPTFTWFDPQPVTVPQRFYRVVPGPIPIGTGAWEVAEIGTVWSDDFNRADWGTNWIVLGGANVMIVGNELLLSQADINVFRQLFYLPWQICSDQWTIRWSQRFGVLDANSRGVGVGIKNFQDAGGNDRGYNGLFSGAGADFGKMEIQRFNGSIQIIASSGPAIPVAAGQVLDCTLTRSGWTMTATASNRANAQVSSTSLTFSDAVGLIAPTISRVCIYPIQGTVYLDDVSFSINHRKPARFIALGASLMEGYNSSGYSNGVVRVIQRSFQQAVCNDSSSYNTTSNTISILPEILAHQPSTAILSIGGNDNQFGYPTNQWQSQYLYLVSQLQLAGVAVKHCLPPPRNVVDLTMLKDWINANFSANDIIDLWTPFLQGGHNLNPVYDSGDGVHLNDAGHLLMGTIISTNLP